MEVENIGALIFGDAQGIVYPQLGLTQPTH
jgi:hypothetical protein